MAEFYQLIRAFPADLTVSRNPFAERYAPAVRHPECGHELAWESAALPLDVSDDPYLSAYLGPPIERKFVTPSVWGELARRFAEAATGAGHPVPWLFPGMRVGPLHACVEYENDPPAVLFAGQTELWSTTLLQKLAMIQATGFDYYPTTVEVTGGGGSVVEYCEIVCTAEAPTATESHFRQQRCSTCGAVQDTSYSQLILDEECSSGYDFVRPEGLFVTLVSRRVRDIIFASGTIAVILVPASRIGVGPGSKSLTEVLADLEFERQLELRRLRAN